MEGIVLTSFLSTDNVSFILVFLEGILSFFSPCVIPLLPVYISYLAGNAKKTEENEIIYERKKVFLHTLFFVLGISFAFFVLGMSFTALGKILSGNRNLLTKISGILIVVLGLFQLGVFDFPFLQKERKLHINTEKSVNPFMAFLMGFTFSFAWTPCIGPALSSVLIMAAGAKTSLIGNALILVYAAGFVLPFLLLGLFTTQVLQFLKSKQRLLKYTIKTGGIILIIMGIMTFTGWMNGVSSYLNSISFNQKSSTQQITDNKEQIATDKDSNSIEENISGNSIDNKTNESADTSATTDSSVEESAEESAEKTEASVIPEFDFTLTDQYGKEHTLSDYKGKIVFLNFWATWCPPCNEELPDIEELYKEYNLNKDEVVFLGVTNPKSDEYPNNQDEDKDTILSFLETKKYTFPTLFDETGDILQKYSISAFPTTFMINKEGNIIGYVPGMMTKDIMKKVIKQTLESTK